MAESHGRVTMPCFNLQPFGLEIRGLNGLPLDWQAKGLTWFTPGEDQSLISAAMLKAGFKKSGTSKSWKVIEAKTTSSMMNKDYCKTMSHWDLECFTCTHFTASLSQGSYRRCFGWPCSRAACLRCLTSHHRCWWRLATGGTNGSRHGDPIWYVRSWDFSMTGGWLGWMQKKGGFVLKDRAWFFWTRKL